MTAYLPDQLPPRGTLVAFLTEAGCQVDLRFRHISSGSAVLGLPARWRLSLDPLRLARLPGLRSGGQFVLAEAYQDSDRSGILAKLLSERDQRPGAAAGPGLPFEAAQGGQSDSGLPGEILQGFVGLPVSLSGGPAGTGWRILTS
jgi:hypothetical protein